MGGAVDLSQPMFAVVSTVCPGHGERRAFRTTCQGVVIGLNGVQTTATHPHHGRNGMDDVAKYLLDSLDRTLQDSHALGGTTFGVALTFATSVLIAHGQGFELIRSWPEKLFFTAVLVIAFAVYTSMLLHNARDIEAIVGLLKGSSLCNSVGVRCPDLNQILATKSQYLHRCSLLWIRLGGVGLILLILWGFMVDLDDWIARRRYRSSDVPPRLR
jgi:hypothetical protein